MANFNSPLRDATQVAICSDQKALANIPLIEFVIGTNGLIIVNPRTPSLSLLTRPYKNETKNITKIIARRATELLQAYFAVVDVAHERGLKATRQPSKAWISALEYLRTKNWPFYSVTEEKMQLVMVAFADARIRYLDNGGSRKKVPLKASFFKTLADLLDRFNEMRHPLALPAKPRVSKDATSSTASSSSAGLPSHRPSSKDTTASLFVSSPLPPNYHTTDSGARAHQHDDAQTSSLFYELQQVKDNLEEAEATIVKIKNDIKEEKEMAKRLVWAAVLPDINELREQKGLPL